MRLETRVFLRVCKLTKRGGEDSPLYLCLYSCLFLFVLFFGECGSELCEPSRDALDDHDTVEAVTCVRHLVALRGNEDGGFKRHHSGSVLSPDCLALSVLVVTKLVESITSPTQPFGHLYVLSIDPSLPRERCPALQWAREQTS